MKRLKLRWGILGAFALTLVMLAGALPSYASGKQSCVPNPVPATFVVTAKMVMPDSKPPPSPPAPSDCPVHPGRPCDCPIRVFTVTEPDCPVAPAAMCCNQQPSLPVGNTTSNDNVALVWGAPLCEYPIYYDGGPSLTLKDHLTSATIDTPRRPPR